MKKVAIFCDYYGDGGIEKVVNDIYNNLKDEYKVDIITTIYNSNIYKKPITISKSKTKNPIYRFIKTTLNIKKYTKKYDIIHLNIHSPIELFYASLIKNKKIIIHSHNSGFDKDYLKIKTTISKIFKKLFLKQQYTYIACSKDSYLFTYNKTIKCKIIPNKITNYPFNIIKRNEMRNKYNIKDEIVIGHIGRFEEQKNHEFIIKVFKEFNKIYNNSLLFLIGTGNTKNKIIKLLKQENLYNKTVFIDYAKDIGNYYQLFDFFIFPSKYEGYGICLYEALSSSLKTFSTIKTNDKDSIYLDLNNEKKWALEIYKNIGYKRTQKQIISEFDKQINNIYKDNELISIILPVYNSQKYIKKCINSILKQTYTNFELIIINDGSTDNTENIIKQYKDKRIKIIKEKNKGTGYARNNGLKTCNGKYICFIDSDDYIDKYYLEYMYNLIKIYDADITTINYKKISTKNKIKILTTQKDIINNLISLPEKMCMSVIGKLFKKEIIKNIKFDETSKFEDIEFATNAFINSNKVIYSTKTLYHYNFNNQNSRSKSYKNDDKLTSCQKSLQLIPKEIKDNYITYMLFNAIAITNMMIINNDMNYPLLNKINSVVKTNIKYVKKSNYNILKKLQLYLYLYNFNLYKKIYKKLKQTNVPS